MADIFGKSLNWPGSTFTSGAFGEMGKKQAEMQKEFSTPWKRSTGPGWRARSRE